jgi:hypothetical protein
MLTPRERELLDGHFVRTRRSLWLVEYFERRYRFNDWIPFRLTLEEVETIRDGGAPILSLSAKALTRATAVTVCSVQAQSKGKTRFRIRNLKTGEVVLADALKGVGAT